jgi:hypothetical protein
MKGEVIYGRTAERRQNLKSTFHHMAALVNCLNRLDPRSRLSLMGSLEGRPVAVKQYSVDDHEPVASADPPTTITWGVTNKRLDQYEQFDEFLQLARDNAWALFEREKPARRGAPQTSDAVIWGIPALARLWRVHRGTQVSSSRKQGEFGCLAVQFFRLLRLFPDDAPVLTKLREYVADIRQADSRRHLDHQPG